MRMLTAGGDFHPALKMNDSVVAFIIRISRKKASIIFPGSGWCRRAQFHKVGGRVCWMAA